MNKVLLIFYSILLFVFFTFPDKVLAVDSNGTWVQTGSLNINRSGHGIALLDNGEVLVTGGYNGSYLKSSEIYNPISETWRLVGDLNDARILFLPPNLVRLESGNVLVSTGETNGVNGLFSTEIYNANTESWGKVANVNIKRFRAVLAPLPDGKVLLASGSQSGGSRFVKAAELYNPDTNVWTFTSDMHKGRDSEERFAVLHDGKVLIAGGESAVGVIEDTAEVYDPSSETWTLSTMPYKMLGGTMVTLEDGRVLLAGGKNGVEAVSTTAIYEPSTNSWEIAAPLNTPRELHTAFLLDDGKVIVFGGRNKNNPALKSSEIYDPDTNTWVSGPDFPLSSMFNVSVRLSNGDYLVTGGFNGINQQFSDSFLFTNGDHYLSVPVIKQTSEPWNDDVYNTAQNWASDPSFSRWGCAVTSAAMVFKYHGLDLIENEVDLDPGSINEWLKSQPDGYVRNGLVNWLALTRLSREISDLNESNFTALEFEKIFSTDHQLVKDAIDDEQNPRPDILRVPGHFVVGKGYDDETILINDPFEDTDKLAFYSNNFENISRFTPSNTDLSYIMLTIDEAFDIKVFDESNNEVGVLFLEDSITDPSGEVEPTAPSIKTYYFRKPPSGIYRVEVNGPPGQEYGLEVFLYDEMGNVSTFLFEEEFEETHIYDIAFNKQDSAESNIEKVEDVTYDSLLKDINELYREKEIKFGGFVSLTAQLKAAQLLQWNNKVERKLLNNFKKSLPKLKKAKQITSLAEEELKTKIDILIKNI